MQIAVLGIDLGKNSCSIVGLDASGAVVLRRRMRREGIIKLAEKLKPCVVAIEVLWVTSSWPRSASTGPRGAARLSGAAIQPVHHSFSPMPRLRRVC